MNLHIGYHESTSEGLLALGMEALSVGADTFAFFTRNPRGGQAKAIDPADAQALNEFMKEHNFAPPVAHAPYTMNPCSSKPDLRQFALEMMIDDFVRLEYTPGCFYNFHPGSHTGQGSEIGIELTATMIADVFKTILDPAGPTGGKCSTILLIETMSGKGSEIGCTFEEVRKIIDLAEEKFGSSLEGRLGVCMDTCHIWDGGYDIVKDLDGVIAKFDSIVGLKRLKAMHINDSKNEFNSHKDRHELIGKGFIGFEALHTVTKHPALKNLPFILETPNDKEGYKAEIEMLRK